MSRVLAAVTVTALSLGVSAPARAPIPARSPALYYPTKVGTVWVYEYGGKEVVRTTVTGAKEKDGVTVVEVALVESSGESPWETVSVSPKSLSLLSDGPFRHDPPLEWLKIPAKAGDFWKVNTSFAADGQDEIPLTGTVKVGGVEKVETPAGTFEAVRVEGSGMAIGKWSVRRWYAPSIGLVRWVDNAGTEFKLKSFTLGN